MPSTAKADTAPRGVRRLLDAVYDGAGAMAAVLMIGLLFMVLLSIVSRQLHFHVRGTDAYAGYLMAGAGFLALAHTLKRGEHIRVTLLLGAVRESTRRALEIWSLGLATVLATLFALYSCRLVWQSLEFHDISTGNDATPLWIPQLTMALGTSLLALAFADEWILEITGRRQSPAEAEMLRNE